MKNEKEVPQDANSETLAGFMDEDVCWATSIVHGAQVVEVCGISRWQLHQGKPILRDSRVFVIGTTGAATGDSPASLLRSDI